MLVSNQKRLMSRSLLSRCPTVVLVRHQSHHCLSRTTFPSCHLPRGGCTSNHPAVCSEDYSLLLSPSRVDKYPFLCSCWLGSLCTSITEEKIMLPLILFFLYLSLSQAQAPSPPPCALACGQSAASQAGCDLTDTSCLCTSPTFFQSAATCVGQTCSASDATTAGDYFASLCASAGPSGPVPSSTEVPSTTDTSSEFSSSSTITFSGSGSTTSGPGTTSSTAPTTLSSPNSVSSSPTTPQTTSSGTQTTSGSTRTASSLSGNAAATVMPTHVAALVAGGIGALVAVVV
ncbi:hypothetical protein F5148DRAFT_377843 [Russula earlei]|uniref:Uncharacterized protein n=1 Tax=Russula earlei TaxID=71964 RepID=A0ACC0UIB5_9AGAM|nr:hypothetical protein F5148DRAFT_377843 [Russula earlei]